MFHKKRWNGKMKESQIQKSILDYLQILENQNKAYVVRTSSGAVTTDTGRYFKTGKAGCPDILFLFMGKYIGLEVKIPKGKQSENQKHAEDKIQRAGGFYRIVTSVQDTIDVLKEVEEIVMKKGKK